MNRKTIMRDLIRRVQIGPALDLQTLGGASPLVLDADRVKAENALQAAYTLWAETWVLPPLKQIEASWTPDRGRTKAKPDRKPKGR